MKRKIFFASGVLLLAAAVSVSVYVNNGKNAMNEIFSANVEALASGEMHVSTCLGLWGTCTLPNGTISKAPAVEVSK